MKESAIYEQLARYMNLQYPLVPYHYDLQGVNNPSPATRAMYSRLNGRAWPDLFIPWAAHTTNGAPDYHGLFIEIKREGTRLKKRDGSWADHHLQEQALMLANLRAHGYAAVFGVGIDECIDIIDHYMKGTLRGITEGIWNTATSTASDKQQETHQQSESPSSQAQWQLSSNPPTLLSKAHVTPKPKRTIF